MAQKLPEDGSSTSKFGGEASDSMIQINVMTLDSQIHSFVAGKNMEVSLFKETLATVVDVPVCQQRLIFSGNFLKDDHLLSEYHLDNGHTLHLVARRPSVLQESSDARAGQTNRSTGTRGSDAESGDLRNRVGANPSLNAPIPNALSTLSEFMHFMEATHSQNGYQQSTSSVSHENLPIMELPTNRSGLPTPEALSCILRLANSLLSGHTVATLSHFLGCLELPGASSDPTIREQVQEESVQAGNAMQQLGSLSLELGRVMQTLHIGQTPAESSVNSGPAVYVSPSGPNPLMVQIGSLSGGPVLSPNAEGFAPVVVGNALRSTNIHINAAVRRVTDEEATGSTNSMALDLNDDALLRAISEVEDRLNEGNGISAIENYMDDDALSHAVSAVGDRLDELMSDLNNINGYGVDAIEDQMDDDALLHAISAFDDRLSEVTSDLNYITESIMMLQQEIQLGRDLLDYLRDDEW